MRNVLDKIWQNLRVEFDVGCATADNTTIVVEPMGKSSIDTSPPSATAITATTTTTTTIPTTLTSTKKRKNKN
jgi:hypothetical protein